MMMSEIVETGDGAMHSILAVLDSDRMRGPMEYTLGQEFPLRFCTPEELGSILREQSPAGLILDLYLPGTTGLTLLQEHRSLLPPAVVVLSPVVTDDIRRALAREGVATLLRTPCTMGTLAGTLRELLPPEPSDPLRAHLLRLRLSPRLLGFSYISEGVRRLSGNPQLRITKELYPDLARQFGTTPEAVEQAIRSCIRDAWLRRDPKIWDRYFPGCVKCPANREFMATLAEYA